MLNTSTRKTPQELDDYEIKFNGDVCISFSYVKLENPADEELAPRILQTQIYLKNDDEKNIQEMRIELWDKRDPDFLFISKMSKEEFQTFQQNLGTDADFPKLIDTVISLLLCLNFPF